MNDRRLANWRRQQATVAVAGLVLLIGCSGDGPPAADNREKVSPDDIQLVAVDRDGYDEQIAALRGRVVLVDFWASWCAPCLKELPHTVALAQERGKDGLACVTVAMEDPDASERLVKLLAQRNADATVNLVSQAGGSSPAMEAFEIAGGALPHYKLYDQRGKLRETFGLDPSADSQYTTADIDAAVDRLLAETGESE